MPGPRVVRRTEPPRQQWQNTQQFRYIVGEWRSKLRIPQGGLTANFPPELVDPGLWLTFWHEPSQRSQESTALANQVEGWLEALGLDPSIVRRALRLTALWLELHWCALPDLAKHIILGSPLPRKFGQAVREPLRASPRRIAHFDETLRAVAPGSVAAARARLRKKNLQRRSLALRDLPLILFDEANPDLTEKQRMEAWNNRFRHMPFKTVASMTAILWRVKERLDKGLAAYLLL